MSPMCVYACSQSPPVPDSSVSVREVEAITQQVAMETSSDGPVQKSTGVLVEVGGV